MRDSIKIRSIEDLADELSTLRTREGGQTVVQCHGVFDLLHIGHIRHFEESKRLGDILVVTVTPDRFVNKGINRPAFSEDLRVEGIAALNSVDYVMINRWPTSVEAVKLLKPDIYVKGGDYANPSADLTGNIIAEEEAVRSVGGTVAFTEDIVFSSSNLINRHLPVYTRDVQDYLSRFAGRHSAEEVIGYLNRSSGLSVLVVGETIIDEYQYCEAMGKSAKEPVLAARYVSGEKFAGGVLAIANHLSNFCDRVGVATMLGADDAQEEFVRDSLNSNVDFRCVYKAKSPTISKRRFVESYLLQKLFEVYEMSDDELDPSQSRELCSILVDIAPSYDVVIVADYGHGMMTSDAIQTVCQKSPFLAVNTQANAGNRGFNTISKYPRADYVSIANHELALDERDRTGDPRDMVMNVSRKLNCDRIVITRGKYGSLCYSADEGFVEVPAFAREVVDRMGAGDAVLSLTSLCVAQKAPIEIVGLIGNLVGAHAVATLGHSESVQKVPLMKQIESCLKSHVKSPRTARRN